ncbi:hypothetical protein ACQKWADRAFT_197278 [Trichoderma austrokoningii]
MASTPGKHTGILREENIALRQILGYHHETHPPYVLPEIGQYLSGTSMKDVLLICVDVDTGGGYEVISPEQSFHIGISILDTRCLIDQLDNVNDVIKSYQFINKNTKPCKWAAKHFLFEETELLILSDFAIRFSSLTHGRNYIITAYGTNEDVKFFNNLNPDITAQACYVLDIVKVAQHPLRLYYRYSLEKMLDELDISYAYLHAAGNDAHFALKALLMIAVRDSQMVPRVSPAANEKLFRTLDAIAHAPIALPTWTERPPAASNAKLGVKAKRRLRAARKAARRGLEDEEAGPKSEDKNKMVEFLSHE